MKTFMAFCAVQQARLIIVFAIITAPTFLAKPLITALNNITKIC
jgi:hypothetical protein